MHSSTHSAELESVLANAAQRGSLAWLPILAGHAVAGEARQAAEAQLIAQAESFGDAAAVHTRATEVCVGSCADNGQACRIRAGRACGRHGSTREMSGGEDEDEAASALELRSLPNQTIPDLAPISTHQV